MQKLLRIIDISRKMRKHIFLLSELVDIATEFGHVAQVSRRIRLYQEQILTLMNDKPGLIVRVELRSLRLELRSLRGKVARKTIEVLNKLDKAA